MKIPTFGRFVTRTALAVSALLLSATAQVEAQATYGFASYHVTVNSLQTILSSNGVQSVTKFLIGTVDVKFNRPVNRSCSFVTSIVGVTAGQAVAIMVTGSTDTVRVRTFTNAGALQDRAFALIVNCGA